MQRVRSRSSVDAILLETRDLFGRVFAALRINAVEPSAFDQLRSMVEALPLTTRAFAQAICRIANASRYYQQGELGAATYELAMAERSLARSL